MAKAKRIKGINCKASASHGVKLVLLTRFEELVGFQEAALNWTDPEGVHSMRVASRRLRSALRDFAPYVRKRPLASVLKQLRRIADSLGEVRDQDVAIMALEKMVTHAPADFASALQQFIAGKRELRDRSREALQPILEKTALSELEADFIVGVAAATAVRVQRTQTTPEVSFLMMSQAVIQERLREFEKLSNGLFQPFEIENLHEMRIGAKRLRYAIELFQQCWGRSIASYAKRAARIQTALGDVHDCDVWIESVGKQILQARKTRENDQITALMWLLSHLVKLRTKHLRAAFTRWREWELQDASGKLRAVLQKELPEKGTKDTQTNQERASFL